MDFFTRLFVSERKQIAIAIFFATSRSEMENSVTEREKRILVWLRGFFIRIIIACIIFLGYFFMNYSGAVLLGADAEMISEFIAKSLLPH